MRTAYRAGLVLSLIGVLAALAVLVALVVGREDLASPATAITLFCASGGGAIVALTTERRAAD